MHRSSESGVTRRAGGEGRAKRLRAAAAASTLAFALGCGGRAPVVRPSPLPAASTIAAAPEAPLGDVTLQSALEAAWDGEFVLCAKRARTALSIASDDLETMELTMRCANAQRGLPEAVAWVKSAYAARSKAPVVRFGLALATLLKGDIAEARRELEMLAPEVPIAAYHAALAAQIDDDGVAAEKYAALYVKANPTDPAGRALQTEMLCAIDLARCNAALETVKSTDDDDSAIARRLGAAFVGPVAASRTRLLALTKDAETLSAVAFNDAFGVAAALREGADPATVLVRSPRSGRPEPGAGVDLVRLARPIARVPFATRVTQLAAVGDPAAGAMHGRMSALFPSELSTWRLARRWDKTATAARKELERAPYTRWRAVVATTLARTDEFCELSMAFPWTDRGPIANAARARCELSLDPTRGRKIADARLAVLPYGQLDVEVAIEGQVATKDAPALAALARGVAKLAPASSLPGAALWAAGEVSPKKGAHAYWTEALALSAWDPALSRRLLQKYVDARDIPRARLVLAQALVEAPLDAFLCGVLGEILLHDGKAGEALPWLTKSCVSARARKEQDVLANTLSSLSTAVSKAKSPSDKTAREAALKCAKGD